MKTIDKIEILFKMNVYAFDLASYTLSFLQIPNYIKNSKKRKKNKELIEKKKSKKCYILGLGPSLKDVDLSLIDGDSIAVNNFYRIDNIVDFTPTFYMAIDGGFANQNNIQTITNTFERYGKATTYILLDKITKYIENNMKYKDELSIYSVIGGGRLFNHKMKIDFAKRIPIGFNILPTAVMLAAYMGYEEIILLGADFNSFASQKSIHAYSEHDDTRTIELWKELYCYSIVSHVHKELSLYGNYNNISIINATNGSLIDSYKRKENYLESFQHGSSIC